MLLKYFYDSALAHASYMVGCQKTGEAIVVDPGRGNSRTVTARRCSSPYLVWGLAGEVHSRNSAANTLRDVHGARCLDHVP